MLALFLFFGDRCLVYSTAMQHGFGKVGFQDKQQTTSCLTGVELDI